MAISWNSAEVRREAREAIMRGVVKGTEAVREEAINLILNTAKTGTVYVRRGVEHQASAPGQPPASDTGALVNSIRTVYDSGDLSGTVTVTVAYGAYLEYGTENMEARPFLRPALANKRVQIENFIVEELNRVLEKL